MSSDLYSRYNIQRVISLNSYHASFAFLALLSVWLALSDAPECVLSAFNS